MDDDVEIRGHLYARRRWGRGRIRQLIERGICEVFGHAWWEWHFDWPYDVPEYWEEIGEPVSDPRPDEVLSWGRGCDRECGVLQIAHASLLQSAALPGKVGGVPDNPIKIHYGGARLG